MTDTNLNLYEDYQDINYSMIEDEYPEHEYIFGNKLKVFSKFFIRKSFFGYILMALKFAFFVA